MAKKKDSEEAQKAKLVGEILYLRYPTYLDSIRAQPSSTTADYHKKEKNDERLAAAVDATSITKLSPFDAYLISENARLMKDYTIEELDKIRDEEERNKKAGDKEICKESHSETTTDPLKTRDEDIQKDANKIIQNLKAKGESSHKDKIVSMIFAMGKYKDARSKAPLSEARIKKIIRTK